MAPFTHRLIKAGLMLHFKRSRLFLRAACAIPLLTSACTPAGGSPDGQNVAPLVVAVTARSASAAATVLSAGNAPYTANNLTDGNQGSYWESTNGAFPQWAQVDLGSAATVEDIVLRLPADWGSRNETPSLQSSPH